MGIIPWSGGERDRFASIQPDLPDAGDGLGLIGCPVSQHERDAAPVGVDVFVVGETRLAQIRGGCLHSRWFETRCVYRKFSSGGRHLILLAGIVDVVDLLVVWRAQPVECDTQAAQQQIDVYDVDAGCHPRDNIRQPAVGDHFGALAAGNLAA